MKNKANKIREQNKLAPILGGDEMARLSAKAVNNPYCIARLEAAKYNNRLANRESAANELGISKDSLMDYELNLCKTVPVDKVIVMADVYNAPELKNWYCSNVCPLGAEFPKIEIEDLDRLTVKALSTLREISNVKEDLLDITADGAISVEERPKLNNVIKTLDEISNVAQSLKLWAKKNLSKTE